MIHWELCKKLEFDYTAIWYMCKPESILENETYNILWDFEIQIDPLIPDRRLDLVIIDKRMNLLYSGLCHPSKRQSENQRKGKEREVLRTC